MQQLEPSAIRNKGTVYLHDDVVVLELLKEGDLSDGRAGHSLVLSLESDLLKSNVVTRVDILSLVDDSVRS